ncbi:uncharacterized protein LOC132700831 [Cylas formicarius]|uniref:uncharacterized protein LOC132700831 n=1 Tax=Cylas formicarius TaxID=197179 RepID=UPI002958C018|nr:uncharacterized protein LOC132700831 [Cylas formicarius]
MFEYNIDNNMYTLLGLYTKMKPDKTDYSGYKKITLVNVALILCACFLVSFEIGSHYEYRRAAIKIASLALDAALCASILTNRYLRLDEIRKLTAVMESMEKTLGKQPHWKNCVRTLADIVAVVVVVVIEAAYCCSDQNFYRNYCWFEIYLFLILSVESNVCRRVIATISKMLRSSRRVLKEHHEEFYKLPPAEFTRLPNGDLMLTGWISKAINCRNDLDSLKGLRLFTCELSKELKVFDAFDAIFGVTMGVLLVDVSVKLWIYAASWATGVDAIFNSAGVANTMFLLACFVRILAESFGTLKDLEKLGLDAYKLFLTTPGNSIVKEERELKSVYQILYKNVYLRDYGTGCGSLRAERCAKALFFNIAACATSMSLIGRKWC